MDFQRKNERNVESQFSASCTSLIENRSTLLFFNAGFLTISIIRFAVDLCCLLTFAFMCCFCRSAVKVV